jgi:hypothetical protein
MISWLRKRRAQKALAKSLRPDPDYRERKLAQFDSTRRQRYFDACYGTPQSLRGRV